LLALPSQDQEERRGSEMPRMRFSSTLCGCRACDSDYLVEHTRGSHGEIHECGCGCHTVLPVGINISHVDVICRISGERVLECTTRLCPRCNRTVPVASLCPGCGACTACCPPVLCAECQEEMSHRVGMCHVLAL
jgi:hypothetical protein